MKDFNSELIINWVNSIREAARVLSQSDAASSSVKEALRSLDTEALRVEVAARGQQLKAEYGITDEHIEQLAAALRGK
jgi:hypothetical protein